MKFIGKPPRDAGKPITKVFQIEKTQEIYVVIDASRLSARESRSKFRRSKFQAQCADEQRCLNLELVEPWNLELPPWSATSPRR